MFGLPPWLLALCLFVAAGVIGWQGGLIAAVTKHFKKGGGEEEHGAEVVNVNTASLNQLQTLPDVDEKLAEAIIKKRPFETVDDLKDVKGIGDKKLAKLRPLIRLQ